MRGSTLNLPLSLSVIIFRYFNDRACVLWTYLLFPIPQTSQFFQVFVLWVRRNGTGWMNWWCFSGIFENKTTSVFILCIGATVLNWEEPRRTLDCQQIVHWFLSLWKYFELPCRSPQKLTNFLQIIIQILLTTHANENHLFICSLSMLWWPLTTQTSAKRSFIQWIYAQSNKMSTILSIDVTKNFYRISNGSSITSKCADNLVIETTSPCKLTS